jgi:hypothetical protein
MCRECGCGYGPPYHERKHGYSRRFLTKEEKIEKLKSYAEELRRELKAAEEHIKKLES